MPRLIYPPKLGPINLLITVLPPEKPENERSSEEAPPMASGNSYTLSFITSMSMTHLLSFQNLWSLYSSEMPGTQPSFYLLKKLRPEKNKSKSRGLELK